MSKIYKTIDLFAGIGGIRRGFELTKRFKNVLSAELDKYACETYKHLYNEDPYNDVTSINFKKEVLKSNFDVLLAGFPCQAFSIAGKQEGFEDKTRGTLFFDVAQIIKQNRPKSFLLENVKGLLTHDKGKTFQIIAQTLDELDYEVIGITKKNNKYITSTQDVIRTPYNFGIPQRRERIFLVGFNRKDLPSGYKFPPLPTSRNLNIYTDLNDLIESDVNAKFYLSQRYLDTLTIHRERHKAKSSGFGYIVVNDLKNPLANTIMATGGSGKERNLIRQYKKEFDSILVGSKKGILNNQGLRHMTPTEWGKLQGFINYAFIDENNNDKFSFPEKISDTQRYKLFGNSVCIPIIQSMAEYIIEQLDKIYGE